MLEFPHLEQGTLIKRYKRFLADIELKTGEIITAHVANSGSMMGLVDAGNPVWISKSTSLTRKLPYSLELIQINHFGKTMLVGVNTSVPNALAKIAIQANQVPELAHYASVRSEVKYGANSRIDLLLEQNPQDPRPCYVEIKNVTLFRQQNLAEFPDAVTSRGAKHLDELSEMVRQGHRAVMLYIIQGEADTFKIAADIDKIYAQKLDQAHTNGVEVLVKTCTLTPQQIALNPQSITWLR